MRLEFCSLNSIYAHFYGQLSDNLFTSVLMLYLCDHLLFSLFSLYLSTLEYGCIAIFNNSLILNYIEVKQ